MRKDVRKALRGRSLSFLGANREIRLLDEYLHEGEEVHDLMACSFGDTGGRALVVVTDERVLVYKDGWVFKNSQAMSYSDIRTIEISTGLFTGKIKFKGEGMNFAISKVGRFAADHAVKIIRSRIGSRNASWEAQRLAMRETAMPSPQQPVVAPVPHPQPEPEKTRPFYETEEPLTLDQFLTPAAATPTPQEPVKINLIDELERLHTLQEKGLLTPEEYALAKHKLLS